MEWVDQGIVVSARKHGESSLIVTLLTKEHGRHAGLIKGGSSRRNSGLYEPGNLLSIEWRARLPEHLGSIKGELKKAYSAEALGDAMALTGLSAACAMVDSLLPEREPHGPVYDGLLALLNMLGEPAWPSLYVRWELGLLSELGFGLDLSACAASGSTENLIYVSPKTGRAVSDVAGEAYKDRLLALPPFLLGGSKAVPDRAHILNGLALTAYFLEESIFRPQAKEIPASRTRFVDRVKRMDTISGA